MHPFTRYQCGTAHDNGNFTAYRLRNYHDNENVIVIIVLPAGTVNLTAIGNSTFPLINGIETTMCGNRSDALARLDPLPQAFLMIVSDSNTLCIHFKDYRT